jgi:hypothetical protein
MFAGLGVGLLRLNNTAIPVRVLHYFKIRGLWKRKPLVNQVSFAPTVTCPSLLWLYTI